MKNVKFFLKCVFFMIIMSCSNKEQLHNHVAESVIDIDVSQKKVFNPQQALSIEKYIPLQTTEDCLIETVDKLYFTGDNILVFDRENSNLFLFDNNGTFIRKIGEKGQGPNEYITFNDVIYDGENKQIYAFERYKSTMFVYNLQGELLNMIKSEVMFNSFVKNEYGYWVYSCFKNNNPRNNLLMLLDENLSEIKETYFPQKEMTSVQFTSRFAENEKTGEQYFYFDGSDIIWHLTNKAESFIQVDFDSMRLPYSSMSKVKNVKEYDDVVHGDTYLGFIENLFISDEMIYFNCKNSGLNKPVSFYNLFYDRCLQKSHIYNSILVNDETLPVNYSKLLSITSDGLLVYAIEPQKVFSHEFDILKRQFGNVSEDDNPIICIYKLKKQ